MAHFDPDGKKLVPADALLIILNRIGFPIDDDQTILIFGACLTEDGKVNFEEFLKIIDYRSGPLDKLESSLNDDQLAKLTKESLFMTKYDLHDGTFNSVPVKVNQIFEKNFRVNLEPRITWGSFNSIRFGCSYLTPYF